MASRNSSSCRQLSRSRTDSGIALGLCQMIAFRSIQPSSWSANATRQGRPSRFFALHPGRAVGGDVLAEVGVHPGRAAAAGGVGVAEVEPARPVVGEHPPRLVEDIAHGVRRTRRGCPRGRTARPRRSPACPSRAGWSRCSSPTGQASRRGPRGRRRRTASTAGFRPVAWGCWCQSSGISPFRRIWSHWTIPASTLPDLRGGAGRGEQEAEQQRRRSRARPAVPCAGRRRRRRSP